ncbi:hypothetical protein ACH47Z_21175 [Streptomyces sp. NPDC020192]|uniref:hypothetical protein n=1 Tax=Streptomyces sp. NPDC020192 TaxID=3365066 RepID=UPI00378826E3
MRRTVRVLSAALVAGAALLLAGPAASAVPSTGPTILALPVNCDAVGRPVPGAVEGPPQPLPDGKPCGDSGGGTQCWPGEALCRDGTGCSGGASCPDRSSCRDGTQCHSDGRECAGAGAGAGAGVCPDHHTCADARDPQHDAPARTGPSRDGDDCAPAGVQHGVEAGQGGSFTDSVPSLVAGGTLIATACAGAGYRLLGHRHTTADRPTGV